jgi:diguanylate cyclase (GGDEF)-like protein
MTHTIVLAEDSLVMRAVVRRCLDDHDYVVVEAEDGAEALTACKTSHPAVVLLDIEMPVLDGYQVLDAIKADPELADIPVVFLTGRTDTADIVEGLRRGAHDYLKKPFEPAELIARVSAAVRLKVLQDELRLRNAELDALGRIDSLTGLFNRRHGVESLARQISMVRRHDLPLTVLMIDLDHFKTVNDRFGHPGGDAVLCELAARLRLCLRTEDVAARWGGEEFMLVLPATDLQGAIALAERIRSSVKADPFTIDADRKCDITLSIGCAAFAGGEPDALVKRADEALYEAKEAGRDRVVAWKD